MPRGFTTYLELPNITLVKTLLQIQCCQKSTLFPIELSEDIFNLPIYRKHQITDNLRIRQKSGRASLMDEIPSDPGFMFVAKLRSVKSIDQRRREVPSGPAALIPNIYPTVNQRYSTISYWKAIYQEVVVSLLLLGMTKYTRRVTHDHHHQKSHDMIENLYVTPSHRKYRHR